MATAAGRVAVTGASGLVGSALCAALATSGYTVLRLVRRPARTPDEVAWDPVGGVQDASRLDGLDAVVHLAGESIAGRWTEARKAEIRRSRVEGTRQLCAALAGLARRPSVLVSASAIGIYGDRGSEVLRENSPPGTGFLAEVCQAWEAATEPASRTGIRVVMPRLGMILSPAGGGLKTMLTPFRLGLGGRFGSGRQFVSWIAVDDVVGVIRHALRAERLSGPVNAVSPAPVTNAEFTRTLARVLSRPALLPLPAFAARLAMGEMADEMLLASQRVLPTRLEESRYRIMYPRLEDALRHLLRAEERP
jgi:uncharacterized protein (TIGR01777 family)